MLLPFSGVLLECVAIVFEAPDDCCEIVDNGRSLPMQCPELTIKRKRIDRFGLRRRARGEGIEARRQRSVSLVQLAPLSGLLETGERCALQFLAREELRDDSQSVCASYGRRAAPPWRSSPRYR